MKEELLVKIDEILMSNHPNKLAVFPIWQYDENGKPYFVMEKPKGYDELLALSIENEQTPLELFRKYSEEYFFFVLNNYIFDSISQLFQTAILVKNYKNYIDSASVCCDFISFFEDSKNKTAEYQLRQKKAYILFYFVCYSVFTNYSDIVKDFFIEMLKTKSQKVEIERPKIIWKMDFQKTKMSNLVLLICLLKEKGFIEIPGNNNKFFQLLPDFLADNFEFKAEGDDLASPILPKTVSKVFSDYTVNKEINAGEIEDGFDNLLSQLIQKEYIKKEYQDYFPITDGDFSESIYNTFKDIIDE